MVRPSYESSLPMEILEEIVGFHGATYSGEKPSTTLLSCLSTSRQFRVCALSHLCAEVSFALDRPHRLEKLCDCIVPGGFGPFIKSVVIICYSGPHYPPSEINEDVSLALLHTLSSQASVRRLSLQGQAFPWMNLPTRIRHSLLSLLRTPTLDHLIFNGLRDLPAGAFARHTSKLVTLQSPQASPETIPQNTLNVRSMTLNPARIPDWHLPKLRYLDPTHTLTEEYEYGWKIIKNCCATLESIRIRDEESEHRPQ